MFRLHITQYGCTSSRATIHRGNILEGIEGTSSPSELSEYVVVFVGD